MTFEMKHWEGEEVKSAALCFLDLTICLYAMVIITHKMQFQHCLPQSLSWRWTVNTICDGAWVPRIKQLPVFLPYMTSSQTTTMMTSGVPHRVPANDPENMKCRCWNVIVYRLEKKPNCFIRSDLYFSEMSGTQHSYTITHMCRIQECGGVCRSKRREEDARS